MALAIFLKRIDSVLFKYRDKLAPVNFSKYNLPYNIEIVDYCDVTSSYLITLS